MGPMGLAVGIVSTLVPADGGGSIVQSLWGILVELVRSLATGVAAALFVVVLFGMPFLGWKVLTSLLGTSDRDDPGTRSNGEDADGYGLALAGDGEETSTVERAGPTDPPSAVPPPPSVSTPIDRGDLVRTGWVGAGPNAMVHRATVGDEPAAPTVAVKEPDAEAVPDGGHRFSGAVENWARIDDHPNVLAVLDWGTRPEPWVALEYGDGGTLADQAGALPLDRALWTATRIAEGIERAHDAGVTHLALSPANVVFRETDAGWDVPKVTDWRVADVLAAEGRDHAEVAPAYAAPEQLHGEFGAPGEATDVYALGAVCYELLTGRPPFSGDRDRVATAVLDGSPPPPTAVDPSLPEDLDDVLLSSLTRDRAGRIDEVTYLRERVEGVFERVRAEE